MASIVEQPWRPVSGPSSPKNIHCLSGGVENVDNKRKNLGKPLSPPRSSSPTGPAATSTDSDSSDGSIPNTSPRPTSSSTTGSNVGLDTTKGRTGSCSNSFLSAVPPPVTDTTVPKAQVNQHHGIERHWNGTHDSPRGLLSKLPSHQHADGVRGNGAANNDMRRITLPSLNIPKHRTPSSTSPSVYNAYYLESTPSIGPSSNSIIDYARRAYSASERTGWSSSPPTSMPPPPLPSQSFAPQLESFSRISERAPGVPRANPLSVSELIHREATGAQLPPTPPTRTADAAAGDRAPSLANEFMDVLQLRERVSDDNLPRFIEELNHQLSLTGPLREARELVCSSLELADTQRSAFAQQTRGMLRVDSEPARDMREVIARAVVGMSRRGMAGFEHEVSHMIDGSLHKPTSPYREAICCAAYAARFPEDQLDELRRQLKRAPLAEFQSRGQRQQQQQPRVHNLPPPREREKLVDLRRPGAGAAKVRKDTPKLASYSLREFPIFSSY